MEDMKMNLDALTGNSGAQEDNASVEKKADPAAQQIKEIISDAAGHKQLQFVNLQDALNLQMRIEVEAHETDDFEGDGIYGFSSGKQQDGALAHRFSYYERKGGQVFKHEFR